MTLALTLTLIPNQVPVLITAVYPAYIEATSVHRKDARWCGCASEFDGMGLPQENTEADTDVSPARGNFPPVAGATIKKVRVLNSSPQPWPQP